MRVVLDTNVIVSRFMVPKGKSAQILAHWEQRNFTLLISEPILIECRRVMSYKRIRARHHLTDEQIEEALEPFSQYATVIEPKLNIAVIKDDPDDDKLIECASAGDADYIVSGDAHLLNLKEYMGIQIVEPSAFLLLLDEQKYATSDEEFREGAQE